MSVFDRWAACAAYLTAHCGDSDRYPFSDAQMRYTQCLWVLCESLAATDVLEIGIGPTAMSACVFLHSLGSRGGTLTSYELDESRPLAVYRELADAQGVTWDRRYGDSLVTLQPRTTERLVDLVYVDGGHDAERAYHDAITGLTYLRAGGYLVIDDYPGNQGVIDAQRQLQALGLSWLHIPHETQGRRGLQNGRVVCQRFIPQDTEAV